VLRRCLYFQNLVMWIDIRLLVAGALALGTTVNAEGVVVFRRRSDVD
jgi:hypothetical protein